MAFHSSDTRWWYLPASRNAFTHQRSAVRYRPRPPFFVEVSAISRSNRAWQVTPALPRMCQRFSAPQGHRALSGDHDAALRDRDLARVEVDVAPPQLLLWPAHAIRCGASGGGS